MARETRKKSTPSTTTRRTPRTRVSSEERHRMIAEAAYYKALERDPDNPDPLGDWYSAEKEIDAKLLGGTRSRRTATRKPRARSPRKETGS